jgi:hypothetical protein
VQDIFVSSCHLTNQIQVCFDIIFCTGVKLEVKNDLFFITGFIYNPLSREEQQRKIIFLPHALNEETKGVVKSLYALPIFEEITNKDANELLLKSSGYPGLLPTANDKLNER